MRSLSSAVREIVRRRRQFPFDETSQFFDHLVVFAQQGEKGSDGAAERFIARTLNLLPRFRWQTAVQVDQVVRPLGKILRVKLPPGVNIPLQRSCLCGKVIDQFIKAHGYLLFILPAGQQTEWEKDPSAEPGGDEC
jgi:hypothetical protein